MGSLVDPSYELVDPTPDVHALFCDFDRRFFDGRLAACEVKWSPRMTTCAGLCCYEVRSGLCQIKLSTPLLKLRPRSDLVETLLHEMIHAFLFVSVRDRDRDGHGPQFQWHMHRINKEAGTRISIYHSFHAEVAVYKQHHWRCSGPCRERHPFFGWVKRTTNRAPSKNDLWWADHERSCGGAFTKVAEPKEFTEKREKAERKKAEGGGVTKRGGASTKRGGVKSPVIVDDPKKQPRIDAVFGGGGGGGTRLGTTAVAAASKPVTGGGVVGGSGGGQMLGGVSGRSRLLDLLGGPAANKSGTVGKENRSIVAAATIVDDDDDCVVIEPPRMTLVRDRPRLRGGSQEDINLEESDNSRDGSDRAVAGDDDDEMHEELQFDDDEMPPAVPYLGEQDDVLRDQQLGGLENFINYGGGGGGGGNDDHSAYGFMNTSMPALSPVHVQNQSQYDVEIAQLEKEIAEAVAELNTMMDGGCDVMLQFRKIEGMNTQLTSLQGQRDMAMAQRLQDELDANIEEISPDEALARRLQKEENAAEKKSQAIVDAIFAKHSEERGSTTVVPQEKVAPREAKDRRRAERRREERIVETKEQEEKRLEREREEWERTREERERQEKQRYPSPMNEPMITPSPDRIEGERMAAGGEGRGGEGEEEERTDELRVTRRRARGGTRARVRRQTVNSDGEEEEQREIVMEEVTIERRHRQSYDMDIDEWMLLPRLPVEDDPPLYEDVGTLRVPMRAPPPAARGIQNARARAAPAAAAAAATAAAARPAARLRAPPAAPVQAVPAAAAAAAAAAASAEALQQPQPLILRLSSKRGAGGGTRGGRQPTEKRPRGRKGVEEDDEMVDAATLDAAAAAAMAADVDGGNKADDAMVDAAALDAAAAAAAMAADVDGGGNTGGSQAAAVGMAPRARPGRLAAIAAAFQRGQLANAEAVGRMEGVEEGGEPSNGDQSHDHSYDDQQSPVK